MAQPDGPYRHLRSRQEQLPQIGSEPWEKAALNGVLRACFRVGEYNEIMEENGVFYRYIEPQDRWEIDHFFEVQHIVNIVWELVGANWQQRPTVQYMDLSSFLNDHRNMYRVPRAVNQEKRLIDFGDYLHHHLIQGYTACRVRNDQGAVGESVLDLLRGLTTEMRNRQGENAELTRFVGDRLAQRMGI